MNKNVENKNVESRRSFLKKAAYVAPTIIALGSITKPVSAAASGTGTPTYTSNGSGETNPSSAPGTDRGGLNSLFGN